MEEPPPSLRPLNRFLKIAQNIEKHEPLVAYCCRTYATQIGIELRAKSQDPEGLKFLTMLMDVLERDKTSVEKIAPNAQTEYVKEFALKIFKIADNEDKEGKADKNTARNFLHASVFIEILRQFDDVMTEELIDMEKYAKWKATDITQALKEGRKPDPGDWMGQGHDQMEHGLSSELDNQNYSKLSSNALSFDKGSLSSEKTNVVANNRSGNDLGETATHLAQNYNTNNTNTGASGLRLYRKTSMIPHSTQSEDNSYKLENNNQTQVTLDRSRGVSITTKEVDMIIEATKYTRSALSALQFDDRNAAVVYLEKALKELTKNGE